MKFITLGNLGTFARKMKESFLSIALKENYDTAYSHSQSAHAPATAAENVIEAVKVNGEVQEIIEKTIDLQVLTEDAIDLSGYIHEDDIEAVTEEEIEAFFAE